MLLLMVMMIVMMTLGLQANTCRSYKPWFSPRPKSDGFLSVLKRCFSARSKARALLHGNAPSEHI